MMTKPSKTCTRRLMATFNQENKRIETTSGNLTQLVMSSVMEKRELKMELLWHFMLKGTKTNSQKLPLSKRRLKIIEQLLKTFSVNQRIWDKVKPVEDPILFMESRMFKVIIHGMLPGAFTENQKPGRFFQMLISANL